MRKTARLVEDRVERRAERLRGREVTAEGFLDDHARAAGAARLAKPLDHPREHTWRDGEIVQRVGSIAELFAERGVGGRSAVVATDVAKPLLELREDGLVDAAVSLDTRTGARPELLDRPVRPRDPDDGYLEMPPPFHRIERGENLLVHEVAGGPEEDEGVGVRTVHEVLLISRVSRIFPNVRRIRSAWPRAVGPGNPPRRGKQIAHTALY